MKLVVLQILCLAVGLFSVHPRVLNPILKRLKSGKLKSILRLQQSGPALSGVEGGAGEQGSRGAGEQAYPERSRRGSGGRSIRKQKSSRALPPKAIQNPKSKIQNSSTQLKRYPFLPLFGELAFLGLRSLGFVAVLMALTPLSWSQLPAILSGFSLAWMLGLVIPGAPGGIGVFEATAIALLGQSTTLSNWIILSAVALYRLVSTLAEAIGAGVAWLDEHR